MCGISASIVKNGNNKYWDLLRVSEIRGQDGTGYAYYKRLGQTYRTFHTNVKASELYMKNPEVLHKGDVVIGQNRLACFGLSIENQQPLSSEQVILVHNGNLYDFEKMFLDEGLKRKLQVDTELILRLYEKYKSIDVIYEKVKGNFACILIDRIQRKMIAFTKDKPLHYFEDETGIYLFSTKRIGQKVFGESADIRELANFSRIEFNFV